MVKEITREMLWEVGAQFGHQTKRWNPKMKEYIYNKKNKIHIIDLQKTITSFLELKTLTDAIAEKKGKILFVGTKKSAKGAVEEAAERTDNFFVNQRWLGGTLTNLKTIHLSIKKLWDIERKEKSGYYQNFSKKELSLIMKKKEKLQTSLNGIKHMRVLPAAIFVVDPNEEIIAVKEAKKLNIPVIGICDTNSDPDLIDYIIPGNDDTYRSVSFLTNHFAEIYAESFKMEIVPAKIIERRRKPNFENRGNDNYRNRSFYNKSGYNNQENGTKTYRTFTKSNDSSKSTNTSNTTRSTNVKPTVVIKDTASKPIVAVKKTVAKPINSTINKKTDDNTNKEK